MRKCSKRGLLVAALLLTSLLTGCTYESGEKQFAATAPQQPDAPQTESATEWLKTAIEKGNSDPDAQKFWYKGFVKNYILSRTTTSMFEGAVIRPDGYNVDARIARQPYQYYRINDKHYVKVDENWMTAAEKPLPFDVLAGFDDLLPIMQNAVQLKDEPIYGEPSIPFQVKFTAGDWLQQSQSPLFADLKEQLAGRADIDEILKNSTVKITVWIGRNDHLLHQYETWIILPLPGGGTMDQQVLFSFYKYNDPGLQIKPPEEVEKYLLY
ncbi:hypothetical protein [Brevibacillus fulvus]|uniref:Lipoprotein n=1 Tax=Brevibacillus fulvus TaxID=1125967 RepID=A0A939BS50_9BACL|nr:hypothetical protein [Brevibacillus fulvus]MBM7590103.1 hypothetical protein [Brevibacillus fulvus]